MEELLKQFLLSISGNDIMKTNNDDYGCIERFINSDRYRQLKILNIQYVVGSEAELKCPECLNKVDQHELDMFGGLCEECSAF